LDSLLQDIRYTLRTLRRAPGFTAVIVLTLALGIGGNTTIFGFLNALLLRPLPVQEPDRLVWIFANQDLGSLSYPDYLEYRQHGRSFSSLAAFSSVFLGLKQGEEAERVRGEIVSSEYFSTFGLRPAAGRFFTAEEGQPGGAPTVVLGHGLWRSHFGGDPQVLGRSLEINGYPFTVVGVAPASFSGTQVGSEIDVWVPFAALDQALPGLAQRDPLHSRSVRWLKVIGRLQPGAPLGRARAEVATIAGRIAQAHPETGPGMLGRPLLVPAAGGDPELRREQLSLLGLLMGMVGLVLLIACANVANLLLARAHQRRGEIGVRQALGASRPRLIRQLLIESSLLALLGGALGLLLTAPVSDLLLAFLRPTLGPVSLNLQPDVQVLLFTLAVAVVTGMAFGLAPALNISRVSLAGTLQGVTRSGRSGGVLGTKLRSLLVVAQVALSLILLVGAGLLLRTLQTQRSSDPGFATGDVLLLSFDLGMGGYDDTTGRAFQRDLTKRVTGLPGVRAAHLANLVPLSPGSFRRAVGPEGYEPQPGRPPLFAMSNAVSPGHFRTLEISLQGRDFDDRDTAESERVAIVNETLARRLWPGKSAIGQRITFPAPPGMPREPDVRVVGVARTVKYSTLAEEPQPFLYLPLEQSYQPANTLFVRTEGDPAGMLDALRRELRELDRDLPVYDVRTLTEQVGASLWPVRLSATLFTIFGILALLLAAMGIYAVVSQSVAQRTHEIGVRLAIGAQRADVFRLVMRQSMKLALIGVAIGLPTAFALTRALQGILFGLGLSDLLTYLVIPLLLAGVAWVAAYMPARRALQVDPVIALRYD